MCKKLNKAHHPSKVLSEMNKASSILRDIFDDSFTSITVDDECFMDKLKITCKKLHPIKNQ